MFSDAVREHKIWGWKSTDYYHPRIDKNMKCPMGNIIWPVYETKLDRLFLDYIKSNKFQ